LVDEGRDSLELAFVDGDSAEDGAVSVLPAVEVAGFVEVEEIHLRHLLKKRATERAFARRTRTSGSSQLQINYSRRSAGVQWPEEMVLHALHTIWPPI
jgi:hypothetical protein